jgi:serine/threonine-protein kinase RsbT
MVIGGIAFRFCQRFSVREPEVRMSDSQAAAMHTYAGIPALGSSSPDAPIVDHARIRIRASADIIAARQQSRAIASLLGFSNSDLTMITTAISEVARNIVDYANEGQVTITLISEGTKTGVKIVVSDQGPGIADISAAMRDGFSTGQRLGIGLPGARRLMDAFEIVSEVGKGTTIVMKKWL